MWRDAIFTRIGGAARARVVVVLACVLGLDTADMGAVGSMAAELRAAMHVSQAQVGLLLTVSEGTAALATLLFGWLVDRTRRTRLLAVVVLLWAVAMALCGCAIDYGFLLATRVCVGFLSAAATPATASLLGDYIPQRDRAKIYGAVLSGELVGTGIGFLLSGLLASLWWRLGFWALALAAVPLAYALHRLPEPARGGASQIRRGDHHLVPSERVVQGRAERGRRRETDEERQAARRYVAEKALRRGVQPRPRLVKEVDPATKSLWWAARYVLSIPTVIVLIVSTSLGYFFLSGLRVFAVEYVHGEFRLSHAESVVLVVVLGVGALVGVLVSGWLSDRLLTRGHLRARVQAGTAAAFLCAICFTIGLIFDSIWAKVVAMFVGAAGLGAINPPLDAARLDVVHPSVRGRAESVRMFCRKLAEGGAPVVVGWLAGGLGGGGSAGMRDALLIVSIALYAAAFVSIVAWKTYLRDTVSADAYAPHRPSLAHERMTLDNNCNSVRDGISQRAAVFRPSALPSRTASRWSRWGPSRGKRAPWA